MLYKTSHTEVLVAARDFVAYVRLRDGWALQAKYLLTHSFETHAADPGTGCWKTLMPHHSVLHRTGYSWSSWSLRLMTLLHSFVKIRLGFQSHLLIDLVGQDTW